MNGFEQCATGDEGCLHCNRCREAPDQCRCRTITCVACAGSGWTEAYFEGLREGCTKCQGHGLISHKQNEATVRVAAKREARKNPGDLMERVYISAGDALDNLGKLYGLQRSGREPDEHFRDRLRACVKAQTVGERGAMTASKMNKIMQGSPRWDLSPAQKYEQVEMYRREVEKAYRFPFPEMKLPEHWNVGRLSPAPPPPRCRFNGCLTATGNTYGIVAVLDEHTRFFCHVHAAEKRKLEGGPGIKVNPPPTTCSVGMDYED